MKKFREFTTWKTGDYFLQLSVVIIGIVVTFAGSNAISRYAQSKEIAATLQLVEGELRTNLENTKKMHDYLRQERLWCKYLLCYEQQPGKASSDSLVLYINQPFKVNSFYYSNDALEMLKMSSLTQKIRDKELVLQLVITYNELKKCDELVKWFYEMKGKYSDKLGNEENYIKRAVKLRKEVDQSGLTKDNVHEVYEMYVNTESFHNLLIYIINGINFEDRFQKAEEALERSIKMINEKYGRR